MDTKPDIFDYNDFRAYLGDSFCYRHQQDMKFSKAYVCKALGLPNSRSYFQDVLNGKFVSPLKIPLFIKAFEMSREEGQFFRALVNFHKTLDDPDERELLFEQLISLNRTPKKLIAKKEFSYYKEWYHSVVRAVLHIIDFKIDGNYRAFARKIFPPVTEKQVRASIQLLRDLDLIKSNKSGFLKPTDKVISTGAYVKDEIIRQYQCKAMEIVRLAILKNRSQPQRIMTKMISVSDEGFNRILKKVEKFNAEITSIVHKDQQKADKVYQLAVALFPHLKKENE